LLTEFAVSFFLQEGMQHKEGQVHEEIGLKLREQ